MINTIYKNLDKIKKRGFILLLVFNSFLFFFEFLSLAFIPIFVSAVIDGQLVLDNLQLYRDYLPFLNLEQINSQQIKIYIGIIAVSLFLLKNLLFVLFIIGQARYFRNYKIFLSDQIYKEFLLMPYELYVKSNPAKWTRLISEDIQGTFHYVNSFLIFLRELLALFAIFILMFFVSPKINLIIVFILISIVFIYLKIIKPILKEAAQKTLLLRKKNIQLINETSGSLKEIKISLQEKYLFNFFNTQIFGIEKNLSKMFISDKLPRVILELVSFTLIVVVSLVYFKSSSAIQNALPTLSLILVSIIRFIPAFNGIATSLSNMKIYKVSVKAIYEDLLQNRENSSNTAFAGANKNISNVKTNNLIDVENLSFTYKDSNIIPIKNINLSVKKGEVVAITGKTGSGKSTLFLVLLGLLKPDKGNIYYNGKSIFKEIKDWWKLIGYVSQKIYLMDRSIKENIEFNFEINEREDLKRLNEVLKISELEDVIKNLDKGISTIVGNDGLMLSGGEKQRIAIARSVYKNPEILFLDEFTSALDEKTENKIIKNLKEYFKGKSIMIITHRKSSLDICDKVYELKNGELTLIS